MTPPQLRDLNQISFIGALLTLLTISVLRLGATLPLAAIAAAALIPMVPLILMEFPLQKILKSIARFIF